MLRLNSSLKQPHAALIVLDICTRADLYYFFMFIYLIQGPAMISCFFYLAFDSALLILKV